VPAQLEAIIPIQYKFRVKIAYRMAIALGINILYWLATVAYGAYQQHLLHETLLRYDAELASPARVMHSMLDGVGAMHRHAMWHVTASTPAERAEADTLLTQDRSRLEASLQGYRDLGTSAEDHADSDSLLSQVQSYQQTLEQVLSLSRNYANPAEHEAALKLLDGSRQAFDALNDTAAVWSTHNEARAHERLHSDDARYRHRMTMLLTFTFLAFLSSVWAGIALSGNVTQPLRQAIELAKAIARGDLTPRLESYGENEMSQLFIALNDMTAQLSGLISDMLHSAQAMELAAGELGQSNDDLSQRTQQQASSLQETTAAMHEITSLGKSNSDNAEHANRLALQTREMAEAGGSVVAQAVSAMGGIKDASAKIASIIGVIDEIAFQTNLLALNAAVEAARAGEQGRGFAVVASEVRALAQRSAEAAKQIKGLIRDSADRVNTGTELVDRSGQTLSQILERVREMTTLIHGIANSTREQSERVLRINGSIAQLDGATQRNASLVEEGSAVTHSLREQADALSRRASSFRVEQLSKNSAPVVQRRPAAGSAIGSAIAGAGDASVTHLPIRARRVYR
jgi:methyl-accepting chemotaxis protein